MKLFCISGCVALLVLTSLAVGAESPNRYVDPFIGTDDMGHTFPGATVPFGFVQLSPQTDLAPYSYGEGYNPDAYRSTDARKAAGSPR